MGSTTSLGIMSRNIHNSQILDWYHTTLIDGKSMFLLCVTALHHWLVDHSIGLHHIVGHFLDLMDHVHALGDAAEHAIAPSARCLAGMVKKRVVDGVYEELVGGRIRVVGV